MIKHAREKEERVKGEGGKKVVILGRTKRGPREVREQLGIGASNKKKIYRKKSLVLRRTGNQRKVLSGKKKWAGRAGRKGKGKSEQQLFYGILEWILTVCSRRKIAKDCSQKDEKKQLLFAGSELRVSPPNWGMSSERGKGVHLCIALNTS